MLTTPKTLAPEASTSPTSVGKFTQIRTAAATSPRNPRTGATTVFQTRRSPGLRRKYTMTARLVAAIRIATPRVATPANQLNTWSTGSRPSTANSTISTAAVTVCTRLEVCGDACFRCTSPSRPGSSDAFAIECWYRVMTLWNDRTQANMLVSSSTLSTASPALPMYCAAVVRMSDPGSFATSARMPSGPQAITSPHDASV